MRFATIAAIVVLAWSGGSGRAEITAEPGWPVTTGFSVSPSATAAQLDEDPQLEIVIASQDQYCYVYNHDGSLFPGWPRYLGEVLWPDQWVNTNSSPAVADLDADGEPEIIVGSASGELYVFRKDGSAFPGFPRPTSFMVYSSPAIGDIDGDEEPEIVVGDNHGYVYAFNTDGTQCPGFPYATPYTVHASPALGDLDGDGVLEIVVSSEAAGADLYAIDGDGSDLPGWPRQLNPYTGIISSPTLADLDLDGSLDVVVGVRNGQLAALDAAGNYKPGWPVDAGYSCESSPTLVDLDDDPELEIIVGFNDSKVVAYNHDGTPLPGWPVGTSYTVISSPSVGDVDGDGRLEIVIGENTGKVYGFEIDGTPVAGFPLLDATYTIYSSPLLADLDLDNHLELLVGCNDTKIYCWDLGVDTYDPELLPWPQWRGDAVNNARLDRPAWIASSTATPSVPQNGSLDIDVTITSIVADAQSFEMWYRVFDAESEIDDWPTPAPLPLELPPGEVLQWTDTLSVPSDVPVGDYMVQAYLGAHEVSAFDTGALMIEVTEAVDCPGDLDGDGDTDHSDLGILLADWGCVGSEPEDCPGDLDGDFDTDHSDLGILLADWGCGTGL